MPKLPQHLVPMCCAPLLAGGGCFGFKCQMKTKCALKFGNTRCCGAVDGLFMLMHDDTPAIEWEVYAV
uniref:Putative secreted protein n=1 Tax=Anopheles triannulatus TaxID=58253 RepID=A0A2M4B7Z3_9DIPT